MVSEIKITNRAECSVIEIEGVIGMPEKLQFRRPGQRVATMRIGANPINPLSVRIGVCNSTP